MLAMRDTKDGFGLERSGPYADQDLRDAASEILGEGADLIFVFDRLPDLHRASARVIDGTGISGMPGVTRLFTKSKESSGRQGQAVASS